MALTPAYTQDALESHRRICLYPSAPVLKKGKTERVTFMWICDTRHHCAQLAGMLGRLALFYDRIDR
ncbi:hypothetical protein [Roseobacter weihaiensis]|uniref:hypothetical protein n=1 Tax=Roseobacter weihaiensis TaxID=2763262 RepID=UPI001D0B9B20|nr:hypothetical protein [Roseobacter sp. H9]